MIIDRLLPLVANLLPLAGVWWWGWDAFEVLILYWMQTVLVVVFIELHIGKLPPAGLGEIKAGGRIRQATHRDYVLMLGGIGFVFCAGHLMFLWVFFSGDWSKVVHGPTTFWQTFVIANGAWLALAFNLIGGLARYILTPPRAALVQWLGQRVGLHEPRESSGKIDGLFMTLFVRIFAMQAAIIFGAMLAKSYGAHTAPLVILIVLKTLFDLASGALAGASTDLDIGGVRTDRK
jgi:hypothetical protein